MFRQFVEYIGNVTQRISDAIHVPVGFFRLVVASVVVAFVFNSFVAGFTFFLGAGYAIYVHNAIALHSIATRVIESAISRGFLTYVWTVGNWSWQQNREDGGSPDFERGARLFATFAAIAILVPVLFGFKAALLLAATFGGCIALTWIMDDLRSNKHRPQGTTLALFVFAAAIAVEALVGWGMAEWFAGYAGVLHYPFARLISPVVGGFIGFAVTLPLCQTLTQAFTSGLGYEAHIEGWRAYVRKSVPAPVETVETVETTVQT
jgi:hypothetical protein